MAGKGTAFDMSDLSAALSEHDKAELVTALKGKLKNLAGQQSDVLGTLSPKVKKRVEVLQGVQKEHDDLEAKFFEERSALETKYKKLYEPLYTKRYEIVNAVVEVEGIIDKVEDETNEEGEEKKIEENGVPNFWLTAMQRNEVLADEIQEPDEGALKYLRDIRWYRINQPKGFKLEFQFDSNPYFTNSVLEKTYHMIDEDEPILEKAIGMEIQWLPGKCLTRKVLKKKPKKGSNNSKLITKAEECESFFNFFNPPQFPEDDDDLDDDTAEHLQNLMEQDFDIGSTIKDKIIPHAVSWFTGEAVQDDSEDTEGEDEDDEEEEEEVDDDDDDDDDDEEDEDDDNEEEKTASYKSHPEKKAGVALAADKEQPPECKQQ